MKFTTSIKALQDYMIYDKYYANKQRSGMWGDVGSMNDIHVCEHIKKETTDS